MTDFGTLLNGVNLDGLKAVSPASPSRTEAADPISALVAESRTRIQGRRALADLKFAQATGRTLQHGKSEIGAPIATPSQGQAHGKRDSLSMA